MPIPKDGPRPNGAPDPACTFIEARNGGLGELFPQASGERHSLSLHIRIGHV